MSNQAKAAAAKAAILARLQSCRVGQLQEMALQLAGDMTLSAEKVIVAEMIDNELERRMEDEEFRVFMEQLELTMETACEVEAEEADMDDWNNKASRLHY